VKDLLLYRSGHCNSLLYGGKSNITQHMDVQLNTSISVTQKHNNFRELATRLCLIMGFAI
jgi:hypothetical protein